MKETIIKVTIDTSEAVRQLTELGRYPVCPDCHDVMTKAFIECEDGSGWYCGWMCSCKKEE